MKPRRENGAAFVSPMTSDVSRGSALMMNFPLVCWNCIPPNKCRARQITSLRGSKLISAADASAVSGKSATKKQGRRRSITPSGLASPDIEIGSRRPVNCTLTQKFTDRCDPFHNRHKKVSVSAFGKAWPRLGRHNGSSQTEFLWPSAPRFGVLAMRVPCRVGSCSDRLVAGRRRSRCFGSLGACEGLPQTVDRLRETRNLLRQPLCVSLLGGEKAPYG